MVLQHILNGCSAPVVYKSEIKEMKTMTGQLQADNARLQQRYWDLSVEVKIIQGKHIFENMRWRIAFSFSTMLKSTLF